MASSVLISALEIALPDEAATASATCPPDDAPETDMARGGVDGLRMARGGTVAPAVIRGAQMRAAFQHLAGDPDPGQAGIVAALLRRAARILRGTAGTGRTELVAPAVPVGGPLTNVPDHVVKAIAVRWIRSHRRGARMTVGAGVLVGKLPLPGVRHVALLRHELSPPGVLRAIEPAARRKFPLRLGGQHFTRPLRVGLGVAVGDVHDRVLLEPRE